MRSARAHHPAQKAELMSRADDDGGDSKAVTRGARPCSPGSARRALADPEPEVRARARCSRVWTLLVLGDDACLAQGFAAAAAAFAARVRRSQTG